MRSFRAAQRESSCRTGPILRVLVIVFLLFAGIILTNTPCAKASAHYPTITNMQSSSPITSIQWWTLKTDHFNVHFHDGLGDVAQEVASLAEHSYHVLESEFGEAPDRIDLVVSDQSDMTNGFTLPILDCITIYTANLRWSDVGNTKNPSWLEALLFHELVHEIELNQVRGGARLARLLFGKIAMPNSAKPIPFIEGVAVYEKYKHLGESRASDSRTTMMARQMAIDDNYPTFDQISRFYKRDSWPSSQLLAYNFGALFMKYIEETHGDSALADIAELYATGSPFVAGSFDQSVQTSLGASIEELYDGFIASAKEKYSAEAEAMKSEGLTSATRLTSLGGRVESPSWSRETGLAAYANVSTVRNGVRLIDPLTGADREAFACIGYDGAFPGLSDDGNWIVYSKPEHNAGPYLQRDLYIRNVKSGRETRLTQGERAYYARFSPDGSEVYYARIEGHDGSSALCAINTATGAIRTVRSFANWRGAIHSFAISPDGKSIAMAMWRPGGYQDTYLMPEDGSEPIQITSDLAQDSDPAWTPDGRHILFSSDPDGVYNIYAANIETGEIRKITNVLSGAFFPAVSPDGEVLLFVGYGKDGYDLFRTDLDIASARPAPRRHDHIPAPQQHQTCEAEITPYKPLAHIAPKFWLPTFTGDTVGAVIFGAEPVGLRSYIAGIGLDLANAGPTYELAYIDQQSARFPLNVSISGGPKGNTQSIAISLPIWGQPSLSGGLALRYDHIGYTGNNTHLLITEGDLVNTTGRDLIRSTTSLHAESALVSKALSGPWTPEISLTLGNSTRLPMLRDNRLAIQVTAGWTGSDNSTDRLYIGGHEGKYPVRGVEHAYFSGTNVIVGSVEYAIKMTPIERCPGLSSMFIDDLQASAFIDAGCAGQEFTLANSVACTGVELGLSVVPGYTDARTLISVGLARPIARLGITPQPSSDFTIYVKLSGSPL